MDLEAKVEFYQFIALVVMGPYILGAALVVAATPFVIAWSYLQSRRSQP